MNDEIPNPQNEAVYALKSVATLLALGQCRADKKDELAILHCTCAVQDLCNVFQLLEAGDAQAKRDALIAMCQVAKHLGLFLNEPMGHTDEPWALRCHNRLEKLAKERALADFWGTASN